GQHHQQICKREPKAGDFQFPISDFRFFPAFHLLTPSPPSPPSEGGEGRGEEGILRIPAACNPTSRFIESLHLPLHPQPICRSALTPALSHRMGEGESGTVRFHALRLRWA